MRHTAGVRSSCVHQELGPCQLIRHVQQMAGGDGVELPPARPFPSQQQSPSQLKAWAPYRQCLRHSPVACLASLDGSGSSSVFFSSASLPPPVSCPRRHVHLGRPPPPPLCGPPTPRPPPPARPARPPAGPRQSPTP